ncbi:hypothetical protein GCM10010347_42070 [Streptomyces cirratus]|uniref:Lipoprotein n=2 Tax=Streptomyces cirratus TaxID=68187 RepID=A0ABQ3F0B5_9ACTN|nr:hypothetical protein GCM10010347_42070 [Streptomyces cirratus]
MLFRLTTVAAACIAVLAATGCSDPNQSAGPEPFTPTGDLRETGRGPGPAPGPRTSPGVRPPTPAPPPPSPLLPRGYVPAALVGEWDGDNQGSAQLARIVFTADGNVVLHFNNRQVLTGPAIVGNSSMVLYVPGGPIRYSQWSVNEFDAGYGYTFENLVLDGVSYVRQTGGG